MSTNVTRQILPPIFPAGHETSLVTVIHHSLAVLLWSPYSSSILSQQLVRP